MSQYETILLEKRDAVTMIRLNRPSKKNAMNPTLHREMHQALSELEFDSDTRALIITGSGDTFCAGQDLKEYFYEMKDRPRDSELTTKLAGEWRGKLLPRMPMPTIAMVNGYCFGGAFGIVANCDLAIAAEEAIFGLSEVNFGAIVGGIVPRAILDTLRWRDVMYYSLTAEQFDGKQAAHIGFVNYAVPLARLENEAFALANKLSQKNAIALKQTKETLRVIRRITHEDDALSYAMAKNNETSLLQGGEWLEQGIGQFMDGQYRPGQGAYKGDR